MDPGSSSEDCYQLSKGIYGLRQAARQFWKKFVNIAKKESFGFQVSPAVHYTLFKENELGICIIILYVDDMLIIGKKEQIQEFINITQKEFSVKIQLNLADYLGCEFHMNKVKTRGWLGQPSIIKSLEQKFGERAMKERLPLTTGTPRFTARRLENPEDKVSPEEHETYRSGVGTLLYLTKHRIVQNHELTGFYPSPKSFWSCTHVNSCQSDILLYINLHILFIIYFKTISKMQK